MDDNQTLQGSTNPRSAYRRRLDRTPDKNFDNLPHEKKILLSTLRGALEEAKIRIVRLRDENDEKDDIIEEERKRRQEAENRLEKYLVDLYNNPSVNSELRQRLPRAKKTDPLEKKSGIVKSHTPNTENFHYGESDDVSEDKGHDAESESSDKDEMSPTSMKHVRTDMVKDSLPQPLVSISAESLEVPMGSSQSHPPSPSVSPSVTEHKEIYGYLNSQAGISSNSSIERSTQSNGFAPLPSIPPYVPLFSHPVQYTNPMSSISLSSLESSSYRGLPPRYRQTDIASHSVLPLDNSEKGKQEVEKDQSNTDNGEADVNTRGAEMVATSTEQRSQAETVHPSSAPTVFSSSQTSFNNSSQPPSHYVPGLLPFQSYSQPSFRAQYGTDNVSHISRLLAEIAVLKKENHELREKLNDAKHDIELLRIDTKVGEDENLNRIGALIEEVHAAEKVRDQASKMIVEVADEDKKLALGELDRLKMKNARKSGPVKSVSESELSDAEDVDDGFANTSASSLNDSEGDSKRRKHKSRAYLERLVARQREILKEEMQKVIDERNEARHRVSKLEKKLSHLELSKYSDRTNTLQAKLNIVERERDIAVAKLQFLMQDVSETKLLYNLHKALLADDPANDVSSYMDSKKMNQDYELQHHKNNNNTADQITKQEENQAKLEARVAYAEKERLAQAEQIKKLEQLVKRQRQKLNTLCAGPMLIEDDYRN